MLMDWLSGSIITLHQQSVHNHVLTLYALRGVHPGGGYVAGEAFAYGHAWGILLTQLRRQGIRARVLSVAYPLAPEHPFPQALLAAAKAYDWLDGQLLLQGHEEDREPEPIVVGQY